MNESKKIFVANAPVSYGAFEVTVGFDPNVPDGLALLDAVAAAGYDGIDLGPVGYLGEGEVLGQRLKERNLGLSGAYIEFEFHKPDSVIKSLKELDAMLDTFDAVKPFIEGKPVPRPTIADAGSDQRRAAPGQGKNNPSLAHTDKEWALFADGINLVTAWCRRRGYEPTLHCETGSFVESNDEIEKVLAISDVDVCLETGHQMLGGGDVYEFLDKWIGRINHVHLKDVTMKIFEKIMADGEPSTAIWANEVFPRLGEGDLDAARFVKKLVASGFTGWLVVEQDSFPKTAERFAQAISDQNINRQFLLNLGL